MNADLHDLLLAQLRDLRSAEEQLVLELPVLHSAAVNENLRETLSLHLEETRRQLERFTQMETELGESLTATSCKAMTALLEEGRKMIAGPGDAWVKDTALSAAAQKVEHYEIAGYTAAILYSQQMGHDRTAELLQDSLSEEATALEQLSQITDDILTELEAAHD